MGAYGEVVRMRSRPLCSVLFPALHSAVLPGHSFRQDVVCGSSILELTAFLGPTSPKVIAAFCALLGEVKWNLCNLEQSGHY